MDALVSIIMPSYNSEKVIGEAIRSVLQQTWQNWELLIVDDASTDGTIKVVSGFTDARIHLFTSERNAGAAAARNRALREAKGRWIAFLDSDDSWMPEKLERQIRFMKETGCHFSYTEYYEKDGKTEKLISKVTGPKRIRRIGAYCYCWQGCLTVMYDREHVGLIQIEDLRRHNDYAMWLQVSKSCDCYLLDEVLAVYRRNGAAAVPSDCISQTRRLYQLWRKGEHRSVPASLLLTVCNVVFGIWKKVYYIKKLELR